MTGRLHKEGERKREQYLDRAAGTLQDGYSKDKIKDFVRYCWQGWRSKDLKHRKPQAQGSYLRTAVDFLFSHNMLLENRAGSSSFLIYSLSPCLTKARPPVGQ
jgi:hypothetical protein